MQLLNTKMQQQIEWRRDRVLELSSQGLTLSDIATMLHVDKSIIRRDVAYLREQAQKNLKTHIQDKLPEEYQKCIVGINQVSVSKDVDDKTRLQALALINDCNKYKMFSVDNKQSCHNRSTTNGVVITYAIKYVKVEWIT